HTRSYGDWSSDVCSSDLIANHLQVEAKGSQVIVGYDTRFMAEVFAAEAANILAANGFQPLLCDRPTPTPAIAYAIRARRASGAKIGRASCREGGGAGAGR